MGYEDFDPEVLDDAVLEELFNDDDEDVEQPVPDEHEGEVQDVVPRAGESARGGCR